VQHFLRKYNRKMDRALRVSDAALEKLAAHDYPGNVRELENLVEQAVALADGEVILPEHISVRTPRKAGAGAEPDADDLATQSLDDMVALAERKAIEEAIARSNGSLEQVARDLGLSSTTLWRKMKRHNIRRER
jgi:two-component system response regulator HydG